MVVKPKKTRYLRIHVYLWSLNETYMHNPFSTPFTYYVLENVGGRESYSFMDGFSRYHQVHITEEDKANKSFSTEWGLFAYTMMSFGLNNSPVVFSRIVVTTFKEFMHKLLEIYFNYWAVFKLLKEHIQVLWLVLDICMSLLILTSASYVHRLEPYWDTLYARKSC